MTGAQPTTYSIISRTLRPARVVIVFDGGDQWSYWARYALYLTNQIWGGAGFALVPHHGGVVDPVLLRACRAYDPDHVVAFSRQDETVAVAPDATDAAPPPAADRRHAHPSEHASAASGLHLDDITARDTVASVCSPYGMVAETSLEALTQLQLPSRYLPAVLGIPGAEISHGLHCPPEWGGLVGAAVASRAGVPKPPSSSATEPELDDATVRALTRWFLHQPQPSLPFTLLWFPNNVATSVRTEDAPLAHDRTQTGLEIAWGPFMAEGLAVVGDTAEDFALARLWHLTYGCGVWLPSVLGTDRETLPDDLNDGLIDLAQAARDGIRSLIITSLSQSPDDVAGFENRLCVSNDPSAHTRCRAVSATELPWNRSKVHLAITGHTDDILSVPTTVDETGTVTMMAPLPAPVVANPALAAAGDLEWHIDYSWIPRAGVLGRRVRGHEFSSAATDPGLAMARSSRRGVSHPSRWPVSLRTEAQAMGRFAGPTLRDLSVTAFVEAKAAERGMTVRVSDAGQRTAQLTRMLDGRDQFVALFGGPLLDVLHGMRPTSTTNDTAYPHGDGVTLRAGEGVLSFPGICARARRTERHRVREQVDTALRAGVLRRGMVLRCQICQSKQFQTIDKLGQRWTCERCDATNDLDHHAWHASTDEPTWFYGLHTVGHHLLHHNGDVPALLADYLSHSGATRPDPDRNVTEIEFVRDGTPRVEVDLIAYRGDTLTVAECKSTDDLAGNKKKRHAEIVKKCHAAAWLQADQLMFATTAPSWKPSVEGAICGVVSSFDGWLKIGCPEIVLVTGLGGPSPESRVLAVRLGGRDHDHR